MEEKKKKDKGYGGVMAGAAGGLAVGAVGGALVEHAVGACYHVRFLELPFALSNREHYPAMIIDAEKKHSSSHR